MPLSIASAQSPGPIAPADTVTGVATDPDGTLVGNLVDVIACFDTGRADVIVANGNTQPGYTSSFIANVFTVTSLDGWPGSFILLVVGANNFPAVFQTAGLRFVVRLGVITSPFAAAMDQARDRVEALTVSGAAFRRVAGDLPIEDEPSIAMRLFEVEAQADAPLTQGMMAPRNRQATRRYEVTVRYDARNNLASLDDTLAGDDDAIIGALEQRGFPSGVQNVTCVGARREVDATGGEEFVRRTLVFEVLYVSLLNPL